MLNGQWVPEAYRTCVSTYSAAGSCKFDCRPGFQCSSNRLYCDPILPLACEGKKPVKVD